MKEAKPKLICVYTDGRRLYGSAAQQHIIKRNGGWDNHHKKYLLKALDSFTEEFMTDMNFKESQPRLSLVKDEDMKIN